MRMTDEQGAREKFRKHSYYIQLLKNILDDNHTLSKIFLATDNLSVINCWKNDFPDVIFRSKSMPPKSGDPIHLTEFSVPRSELTIDAVLDMLILSRSNFILFPDNSAFSVSSAILSGLPPHKFLPIPFRPSSSFLSRLVSKLNRLFSLLCSKLVIT